MERLIIWLRRGLTTGLTTIAFVNSYRHTAQWFRDHDQEAQAQWLALIPEAGVILVVLTLAQGQLTRPTKWLIGAFGAGSLGLTFTANIAAAGPGFMGLLAALVAPVFAVLGFALEMMSLVHEPAPAGAEPVQDEPVPVVQDEPASREPVSPGGGGPEVDREPVSPPATGPTTKREPVSRSGGGLMDRGILWATEQMVQTGEWPSRGQIVAQFPEMSLSTAKRIRAAKPVGTDGTAEFKEMVSA